jgi:hypothetical protein
MVERLYHCPIGLATAYINHKMSNYFLTPRRVCDLWMKLNAIQGLGIMGYRCKWSILCPTNDMKIGGDF